MVNATTPAAPVKINFQPSGAAVPAGYLADTGANYGNRGNGYSYGWNGNNNNTRDRNSSRSLDQRYDTLNQMQVGGSRIWEIAVPNGNYSVFVVAGDANAFDSVYRINVEGVLTVSGTPSSSTRWISGTKTITVSDGRLTVSNGTGAINNKICFIDITPVVPQMPLAAGSVLLVNEPIRLEWVQRDLSGQVTLGLSGATSASYVVEGSFDLNTWKSVATVTNVGGRLSFTDPAAENRSQRFYRVRLNR